MAGEPIPGQLDIEGIETLARPAFDLERSRCSVASMLNGEKLGLNERDFMFVTPDMIEAVAPRNMRQSLIDVPASIQNSQFVVSYTNSRKERFIAVTALEAQILPRSIPALSNNARIVSRAKAAGPVVSDVDQQRAERASIHAQESKLPGVTKYLAMLEDQKTLIEKFRDASHGRKIGLSQFGSEVRFREKFEYLRTFVIADMVRAYGEQRKLDESQMRKVSDTITYATVFSPNKFGNFYQLMRFAHEYNGHKQELARQRKEAMERNIGRFTTQIVQQ
jgi:hypothetical protein